MREILIILGLVGLIIFSLNLLCSMPSDFMKEFEKSCREEIKKRDKEYEEREKRDKALAKWLFGGK